MAYQVIWSPLALDDLDNIARYIFHDSAIQADKVVRKFLELTARYGTQPRAATIVPEVKDDRIRHKHIFDWRVIYEIHDDKQVIEILAIVHNRRSFGAYSNRIR